MGHGRTAPVGIGTERFIFSPTKRLMKRDEGMKLPDKFKCPKCGARGGSLQHRKFSQPKRLADGTVKRYHYRAWVIVHHQRPANPKPCYIGKQKPEIKV